MRALADEAGVSVAELPQVVERPESSAAEVVDEYLWVRCSQIGNRRPRRCLAAGSRGRGGTTPTERYRAIASMLTGSCARAPHGPSAGFSAACSTDMTPPVRDTQAVAHATRTLTLADVA